MNILLLFYEKILQEQKNTKKHQKAQKSTKKHKKAQKSIKSAKTQSSKSINANKRTKI